ncbi:MAG: VOC family protein [Burkholderiaceae bacterium]|jgi:catechol 2,3-dioxygenase-like lactoylglutathione lyase family enzyme
MILGLRTVIYPAPDLAKARDWYTRALNLKPYFDQPFYVGFSVGGFELGLVPEGTPSTLGSRALWGVDSIEEELARLCLLGATALESVTDVGEGIRTAAVTDPFGNHFGLIQNPHFRKEDVR